MRARRARDTHICAACKLCGQAMDLEAASCDQPMTDLRDHTAAIGTRVRLAKTVDNFPTIVVQAGETGVIARIAKDGAYYVRLDRYYPQLDEYNNELEIEDSPEEDGPEGHPTAWLSEVQS